MVGAASFQMVHRSDHVAPHAAEGSARMHTWHRT